MIEWKEEDLARDPVEASLYTEHEENDRPGGGGAGALVFAVVVVFALISIVVIFATIP